LAPTNIDDAEIILFDCPEKIDGEMNENHNRGKD
jgi:hypothetical protein